MVLFSKSNTACPRDFSCNGTTVSVTIECFSKLINGLKNGKASGPDGIRTEHLWIIIPLTATALAQIFQYSVNNGWKKTNVVPVYKSGPDPPPRAAAALRSAAHR